MPQETVCKIVRQYNKFPVSKEDMDKLLEIGEDYGKVKNYVYRRYGGIRSLSKLYPGYTIQNEMTRSGLRENLKMPSVYFYLAVFEALGDIKSQWTRTKTLILNNISKNQGLTEEERHFLRYLIKVNNALDSVLNGSPLNLPKEIRCHYDALAADVDVEKANGYLCRQVRKLHKAPHTDEVKGFSMTERAYRYKDHGIYISIKEKRKRIFIPLTDGNTYTRQIQIRLFAEESRVELRVPVDVAVKGHRDHEKRVGVSFGMLTMLVTDEGHEYGEELGRYQAKLSDWLQEQSTIYNQNRQANPGRKKYYANKERLTGQLHGYINQELNRFIKEEKPKAVYYPRLPRSGTSGPSRKMNHLASTWQRGYICSRLTQKCREQAIELVEVPSKDIGRTCSRCGEIWGGISGKRNAAQEGSDAGRQSEEAQGAPGGDVFTCPYCGYKADKKQNAACNVKRRGEEARGRKDG